MRTLCLSLDLRGILKWLRMNCLKHATASSRNYHSNLTRKYTYSSLKKTGSKERCIMVLMSCYEDKVKTKAVKLKEKSFSPHTLSDRSLTGNTVDLCN